MKTVRVILPFLLMAAMAAGGESLWSPAFKGYLKGGAGLAVGDALVVQIDASSSLSYSSSSTDSKSLTLEFTGGSTGDLFSFLPQARTGGTLTTTGKDSMALKAAIPVIVTAVAPDGTAQVQGSRTIAVQGKSESMTVSGTVAPGLLGQKGTISFSQLANARLAYTTLLASATNVLSAADLQTIVTPAPAAAATAAVPAASGTPAPATPSATTAASAVPAQAAQSTTLSIPEARKKALLLLYLNRLIDIIFNQ